MARKKIVSRSTRIDASRKGRKKEKGTEEVYRGTFEAEWTCSSCGREHISGSEKVCPACSNPRQADEAYSAPEGKQDYLSEGELEEMGVDPEQHLSDETCRYCGAKLKPGTQVCPNCGANLADTGYTTRRCPACERETNELVCPNCGADTVLKKKRGDIDQDKVHRVRNIGIAAVLGMGGLAALCLGLIAFLLVPRPQTATVTAVSWSRTIEMESFELAVHNGWDLPPGAELLESSMQVHHYDRELIGYVTECSWEQQVSGYEQVCGTEQICDTVSVYDYTETICYEDGTCDEVDHYRDSTECRTETVCHDEPVYQQVEICDEVPQYEEIPVEQMQYTYEIPEWVPARPRTSSGSDTTPVWPDVSDDDGIREAGRRTEECVVQMETSEGRQVEYEPSCSELSRFEPGTQWKVTVLGASVTKIKPVY